LGIAGLAVLVGQKKWPISLIFYTEIKQTILKRELNKMTFTLKLSQDEMENMTMLEQAIEKYVDSLGMDGLIDYVTSDLLMKCGSRPALALLWSVYSKAADGDIDEFIEQMGVSDEM
jgi:hypothetical protein